MASSEYMTINLRVDADFRRALRRLALGRNKKLGELTLEALKAQHGTEIEHELQCVRGVRNSGEKHR